MLRRHIAFSVVFAGLVLPACAQSAGGTGQSGGLEGYRGPAYSSYAAVGRSSVLSVSQYGTVTTPQSGAPSYARLGPSQSASVHPNPVGNSGGNSHDNRNDHERFEHDRDDRYYVPYVPLFGVVTLYDTGYPGYSNPDVYVDLANPAPRPQPARSATEYDATPVRQPSHRGKPGQSIHAAEYYATTGRQAAAEAPPAFRPAYQRQQQPAPNLGTEAAVTLIFNDGSPSEQIHSYMLTRKTLYVQENGLREIPVEQLDLAATEQVNKEAGVDFHLPGPSR